MRICLLLMSLLFSSPNNILALFCFDSSSTNTPAIIVNCSENELCYSEFYSVASSSKTSRVSEWHVDRFCVHKEQCLRRGIGSGRCVDFKNLDPIVQKTFRHKLNQKHSVNTHKRLLQSEFCCCQHDFCNKLDIEQLKQRYNISVVNGSGARLLLNPVVFPLLILICIKVDF